MRYPLRLLGVAVLAPLFAPLASAEPLFTAEGTDPPFAAVQEKSGGKVGERFNQGGALGSRVRVDHEVLEKQAGKAGPIPDGIHIHTEFSGSIARNDFAQWTRWYQEDGDVQVFRLFKGEQNVRNGDKDGSPGRVEAYVVPALTVAPGGVARVRGDLHRRQAGRRVHLPVDARGHRRPGQAPAVARPRRHGRQRRRFVLRRRPPATRSGL